MREVLITEFAKLRRSAVPWVTAGVLVLGVLGSGMLIWIVQHPGLAGSLGLLGAKANLAGLEASWPAFGGYLGAITGAGGMLVVAFIVAFLFGREYAEDTAKNMLALPQPRWTFVVAKLIVTAVWWLALVALVLIVGFAEGAGMGLSDFSAAEAGRIVAHTLLAAGATFVLVPVYAWVTVASRNALAAVGFALGMLLLGDLLSHTGWSPWFGWSIAASLIGLTGDAAPVPPLSWAILVATGAAGLAATIHRFTYADNA